MAHCKTLLIIWILSCLLAYSAAQDFEEYMPMYSFDYQNKEYPNLFFRTDGTSVISKNFVKLVPAVPFRAGELISAAKLKMKKFKMDINFVLKSSRINQPYGFAIWYLNAKKDLKDKKGNLFGFKPDYAGLGIFIYKDISGNWIVHGNYNNGMKEYQITDDKINERNACTILGDVQNIPRTLR
jgi:hypothetical protein